MGAATRALELDAAIRTDPLSERPAALPDDAEILHSPSILRTAMPGGGHVAPESGTPFSADVSIHHDLKPARLSARQFARAPGRYDLILDIWDVQGSFASLALALPPEMVERIGREDLIRLDYNITLDQRCDVFARLNLSHGPNVEQVVRKLDLGNQADVIEFDVHYTEFDPTRAKEVWVDLIFNTRPLNRIVLTDLVISRRARLSL